MVYISQINDIKYAKDTTDIHIKTFKGFFLTFLGEGFLKELYKGFITHNGSGIFGAFIEKRLVGFIAFSENSSLFYKFLIKKSVFKFFFYSLKSFVKNPKILFRLLRAFTYPNKSISNEKYMELVSIGVLPSYKSQGIGSMLLKELVSCANIKNIKYIKLDTDRKNNEAANYFYQKNTFVLDSTYITPEGREMNHYRRYLE